MSVDIHSSGSRAGDAGGGFWESTRLVAEREITTQVRSKAFWITVGTFLAGILAAVIVPGLVGGGSTTVATVGTDAERAVASSTLDGRTADDVEQAEELVLSGEVEAAVVPDITGESATGLRVLGESSEPEDVISALSAPPAVEILDPSEVHDGVQALASMMFALIFLMLAVGYGVAIAQSVVTEKQTRIVEILVATIPVRALLAGKILGHSVLVFAQVLVFALVARIALSVTDQTEVLSWLGSSIAWFVPFMLLGFVLLATLWAVAGSVVSRQEDLASSQGAVMALVMLPYFGVIFGQNNELAMTVMSYVPFSAPVAMPVRMFGDEAQAWEPFASMAILVVSFVACLLISSRLYSGSLLQTGSRVGLRRAWAAAE